MLHLTLYIPPCPDEYAFVLRWGKDMHSSPEPVNTILRGFPEALRNHSYNVCYFSLMTAWHAGYSLEKIKTLAIGALLHDIGKTCINNSILDKPEKLTEKELLIVKRHTVFGAEKIKQLENSDDYLPIILYHHERWDGNGYEGLAGNEIPELASIVTIADAFDAMTSTRPYQKPKTITNALKELNINKGTQFSPDLVETFESCILRLFKDCQYKQKFEKYLKNILSKPP